MVVPHWAGSNQMMCGVVVGLVVMIKVAGEGLS